MVPKGLMVITLLIFLPFSIEYCKTSFHSKDFSLHANFLGVQVWHDKDAMTERRHARELHVLWDMEHIIIITHIVIHTPSSSTSSIKRVMQQTRVIAVAHAHTFLLRSYV